MGCKNMENSDKSLYKIPFDIENDVNSHFKAPKIKIAYDEPIKKDSKNEKYTTNIFKDISKAGAEILHFRALAEEEIRISKAKYTRKYFLKTAKDHQSNKFYYKHLFRKFKKNPQDISRALLDLESKVGAQIFGPVSNGIRREFFVLDADSWIWHEEWIDGKKNLHQTTIRYEIREDRIVKVETGPHYFEIKGAELNNFYRAVNVYRKNVLEAVYGR